MMAIVSKADDDFGIKYKNKADADHLIDNLRRLYTLKVDWSGKQYLGFDIKFDDVARKVSLSMPLFIPKVLLRFDPSKK